MICEQILYYQVYRLQVQLNEVRQNHAREIQQANYKIDTLKNESRNKDQESIIYNVFSFCQVIKLYIWRLNWHKRSRMQPKILICLEALEPSKSR